MLLEWCRRPFASSLCLPRIVLILMVGSIILVGCGDTELGSGLSQDTQPDAGLETGGDAVESDGSNASQEEILEDAGSDAGESDVNEQDAVEDTGSDDTAEVQEDAVDDSLEDPTPDVATDSANDVGSETGGDAVDDAESDADAVLDAEVNPDLLDDSDTGSDALVELDGPIVIIPDRDRDGIDDRIDNCVGTSNRSQADGDDDGVGDACDNCEATYNPDQGDYNESGPGDACDRTIPTPCDTASDPYPVDTAARNCRGSISLPGGMKMFYYRNFALSPGDDGSRPYIQRAVIVQHGAGRTGYSYFNSMMDATQSAGADRNTIVIAPHFQAASDLTDCSDDGECLASIPDDRAYWGSGGWKTGYDSHDDTEISSFEVYDRIILQRLANQEWYPNLEEIVLTGHSAGGQFVQRYAVGTVVDQEPETAHIDFRYIVANPSSYVYLDEQRWDGRTTNPVCTLNAERYAFSTPDATGCSDYNEYRYGPEDLDEDHYMAGVSLAGWRRNYRARQVTYMMGDEDVTQGDETNLDRTCRAQFQGRCRYDRGSIYQAYMDTFWAPHFHNFVRVRGVGHTGGGMYRSAEGVLTVFEVPREP